MSCSISISKPIEESTDPIHEENGLWYFWDETWCFREGPYPNEAVARANLRRYCREVLGVGDYASCQPY